jgi:hypothetical protein
LDCSINDCDKIPKEFNDKYAADIKPLRKYYKDTRLRAENRLNIAFDKLNGLIEKTDKKCHPNTE